MTRLKFFDDGLGLIAVKLGLMDGRYLWLYDLYKTYQGFIKAGWIPSDARKRTVLTKKENYLNVCRAIYTFEREGWTGKRDKLVFRNTENGHAKALSK